MTQRYNVELDDQKWAVVKCALMLPERRKALMRELIAHDQQGALRILGELGSQEHRDRVKARQHQRFNVVT